MPPRPVYLDNHATTRTDPRVVEAMLPFFTEIYGNASSAEHAFGWEAETAVETAREQVAALLGARPSEIVFTSGATESNNLAFKGALPALRSRGQHLITTAVEHRAVLDPFRRLGREGWSVTVVPCDSDGLVSTETVVKAMTDRTVLVSVMAANNEVGTLDPIAEIGRACRARGIVFQTDAAQAVGKVPIDVEAASIDLLSLSGHKIYGPKGIGALYVRRRDRAVRLSPLFDGGGQERGLRPGTTPVPLIVGLGTAAEIAARECVEESARLLQLRDSLHERLAHDLDGLVLNGHPTLRLPGNLNLGFEGIDGEVLIRSLSGLAVSSGAACSSAEKGASHVLLAMGRTEDLARASLRFGLGRFTTPEDIAFAHEVVVKAVRRFREHATRHGPRS